MMTTSSFTSAGSRQCAAPLLESPVSALSDIGPWVLSYDEKSISRSFQAKNWVAAMTFLNATSELAEEAKHHPDLHLTNWREVRVVLSTHTVGGLSQQDIDLAKAIDEIDVDFSPKWLREQQEIDNSDAAVSFDKEHYKNGLNGDFVEEGAIAKYMGDDNLGAGLFENAEMRDIAASKDEIVKALKLFPGAVVGDVGAGTGLLEPLLCEAVGEHGKVFASELSPVFRETISERCRDHTNLIVIDDPAERDPKLPDNDLDLVMLVDVYHHLQYPQTVLRNIRASLKRHGALVVIDFHRDPARIQSHDEDWVFRHLRAGQATFSKEIERTGFVQVEEVDIPGLPENYFLVFRKRPLPLSEPGAGWTC